VFKSTWVTAQAASLHFSIPFPEQIYALEAESSARSHRTYALSEKRPSDFLQVTIMAAIRA